MRHLIACIQMTSTEDVEQNLLTAKTLIDEAVAKEAKLIVLPENFALMGIDQADRIKHSEEYGSGVIQDFLSSQAALNQIWIVGGTIPLRVTEKKDKVYSSTLLYNDSGLCVARYDKIHLFDVSIKDTNEKYFESKWVEAGKNVVVVDTPFGKLGFGVCYDVRFPEMFRAMQQKGAELFVLPSAFTYTTGLAHWEILVRARAIENLAYVIAPAQTGFHTNKRRTYGHSLIVNPWGEELVCLPEFPGVAVAEISHPFLQELRQDFPALTHRKLGI